MKEKKIKTLISLLTARERTQRALNKYINLCNTKKLNLDF